MYKSRFVWLLSLFAAAAFIVAPLAAQLPTPKPPNTVFLEELTWDELALLIQGGKTTAIIATAGTEQKGPHLPIGEHRYVMEYTAEQVARALGNAIVAPIHTYVPEGGWDPPSGHMTRAGTITLPEERFQRLLELNARSLRGSGFKDIILIGDSGGNQSGMSAVAAKLNIEWQGSGVRVHFIGDYYTKAEAAQQHWLADTAKVIARDSIGSHANIMTTSELLYLHPQLVRTDRFAIANAATGVSGNPSKATRDIGRKMLDIKITLALAQIRSSLGTSATPGTAAEPPAAVRAQRSVLLAAPYTEAMTWTDIRAAIDGGTKVIVIPTGGVEQNGPHMTLGKHNDIVTFAAGLIATRLGGLVAPTVKWVPEGNNPDVVQRQPGTITNPSPAFESLLDAAARSAKVHGFTDIVLIGDSGGNQRGLTTVADSLNKEWAGTGVRVYALTDYYSKSHADIYAWLEKDHGWNRQVVGSHAGIMDTSQLMYVNPAAVRSANILLNGGGRGSGVNGDPTKATAELGKRMLEIKVEAAVAQYGAVKRE